MNNVKETTPGAHHIPEQQTGSEMNVVEKKVLESEEEAKFFFKTVKKKLLDVNNWSEIAELPMSSFILTDRLGKSVKRKATDGDYIKINIPGPGTRTGKGYDWVIIETLNEEEGPGAEVLTMRVRPAANPLTPDQHTAHFLKAAATSTFQVKRIGNALYAEEHGRNEVPNTETAHILDNIRNIFVGWAAKMGLSYPQWKSLVKGLLSDGNEKNLKALL